MTRIHFTVDSVGTDYSNNATTYTVLLLDIESAHNMSYNGEYLCTIGSPVAQVKAAALKLIEQIRLTRGTTHVAIVTFCQNIRVVQNFTTDYYTMRTAIENITEDTVWADINGAFKKADELLSSVSEANVDKNIVLFSQGVPSSGEYSSSGKYTKDDCSWYRTDNNIYDYQYSNSVYATAEALKSKYNIYSVGLYQSYEGIPEQGQGMLNFAKRVNQDIQNKGYYDVTNVDDLEFSFSQDVFNLAVSIDPDKVYIPVVAKTSSNNTVPAVGAEVTVYLDERIIFTEKTDDNGCVMFSKKQLCSKGINESDISRCTVSAHFQAGEITLCSEEVLEDGTWRGTPLLSGEELCVDEPRWYLSLRVGINRSDVSRAKDILREYSFLFAKSTNGHVIVTGFDLFIYNEQFSSFSKDALEKSLAKNMDICMIRHSSGGANATVDIQSYLSGSLNNVLPGKYYYKEGVKSGVIWCPVNNDYCAETLCHESGHYLFGFMDEYASAISLYGYGNKLWTYENKDNYLYAYDHTGALFGGPDKHIEHAEEQSAYWSSHEGGASNGQISRPINAPPNFGLMDVQFASPSAIEMSRESVYNSIDEQSVQDFTHQFYLNSSSCERKMAYELGQKAGGYLTDFTYATQTQHAEYDYAGRNNVYFNEFDISNTGSHVSLDSIELNESIEKLRDIVSLSYTEGCLKAISKSIVEILIKDFENNIVFSVELNESNYFTYDFELPEKCSYVISVICKNADGFDCSAEFSLDFVSVDKDFTLDNNSINLYSNTVESVAVLSNNIKMNFDESHSVSNNYFILTPNETAIQGSVETSLSFNLSVDYSSLSWYINRDGQWESLDTTITYDEHGNPHFECDFVGDGIYSLMGYTVVTKELSAPTKLAVTTSGAMIDKEVFISFEDSNENILNYNVYYGKEPITIENCNSMELRVLSSNLKADNFVVENFDTQYYFAIQAVDKNGNKSELSECVTCVGAKIDRNEDGLPDYWVIKHGLIESDDLIYTDPDDDGLDNLTEYEYGTNPLNPDTDGDNVYDKVELLKGLDPLNPMTDGATDDYVVAYGTPDLEICEITFDDDYIYFSVKNDTDSKAMRTLVEARVQDETIALWTVNVDEHSIVQFAIDRTAVEDWTGLVLEADGGKLTHDSDYSNNTFTYSAANAISLEDTEMVKRTSQSFAPVTEPDGVNDIYRWSVTEGNCLTSGTVIGEFTANKIGQATIQAETLNGLTADCLISVVSFEGAEYSEFDSKLINNGTEVSIVGYIGDDENVVIPEKIADLPVTEIGDDAFYKCLSMYFVDIPESVTCLGDYAFDSCRNLQSITIGKNVNEIGSRCFQRCENLKTVYFNAVSSSADSSGILTNVKGPFYECNSLEKCIISDDVIDFPKYLFYDVSSLTEVEMGENVESIGTRAFYGCSSLTDIQFPDSLTSIGSYAFYRCRSISDFTLPNNLVSIGSNAFNGCTNLTAVDIPESVTSIGTLAFSGCSKLADVSIANDVASVYADSFDSTAYYKDETNWKDGMLYVDNHLITGQDDLSAAVVKYGTVSVANSAFSGNASLKKITIPKTVKIIGSSAFSNCTSLVNTTIPDSVEQIKATAFNGCSALKQLSVYNKNCVIADEATVFPETTVLCGYENSTTQSYAETYSRTFISLHEHEYAYEIVIDATVSQKGQIEYICSCGESNIEEIPQIAQNCNVRNNLLFGLKQGVTADELLSSFLVSETATITLSNDIIGTGTLIEITNGDGICEELEVVIFGDVDGDGQHNGQDAIVVSSLVTGLLTKEDVSPAVYAAADCNSDGKVNEQDIELLYSAGLMIKDVKQSDMYDDGTGAINVTFVGNGATDGAMDSQKFVQNEEQALNENQFVRSYKVNYELNGGSATITEANTDSIYTFTSWNSSKGGNGLYGYSNGQSVVNPNGSAGGNVYLYAQWTGGEIEIPTPVKEGHRFVGWFTDVDFENEFTETIYSPIEDMTLYAKWEIEKYEVTFNNFYENQFDFDSYDFSSAYAGTVSVNEMDESLILRSTGVDTYTLNYTDLTKGYMELMPGHTYRFSYKWENISDVDETLRPFAFAYNSLEPSELQMYNAYILSAPAQTSGVHSFMETVPEGHPYVTIRLGVSGREQGGSVIKISDICVQDITDSTGMITDYFGPYTSSGIQIHKVSVEYGTLISSADDLGGSLPTMTRMGYTFAGWFDSYDETGNGTGTQYVETSVIGTTDLKLYARWIKK